MGKEFTNMLSMYEQLLREEPGKVETLIGAINMYRLRADFPEEVATTEELCLLVERTFSLLYSGSTALLEELTDAVRRLVEYGFEVSTGKISAGREMVEKLLSCSDEAYAYLVQSTAIDNQRRYEIDRADMEAVLI